MIKKCGFKFKSLSEPINITHIYSSNLFALKSKYPKLLTDEALTKARKRYGTKSENLVVVPQWRGNKERVLEFEHRGNHYALVQNYTVLMDGASSPIRIGDIGNFNPCLIRAFYAHDAFYGLFHNLPKKDADEIFACFAELDGANRVSRMIMYTSLRLFGKKARKLNPKEHWNYGFMKLYRNGKEIKE